METVSGTVSYVNTNDKFKKMLYALFLEHDDTMYKCGNDDPEVEKGDEVEFKVDRKDNVDVDSIKLLDDEEEEKPKRRKSSSPKRKPESRKESSPKVAKGGTDWVAKDRMITFMAATKAAVSFTNMLLDQEILVFPTKVKGEAKIDVVREFMMQQAKDLYQVYQSVPGMHDELMVSAKEDGDEELQENDPWDEDENE